MSLFECQIKTFQIWYAMFWFDTQTKTKYILKTFRGEESLPDQKQSCISWKIGLKKCCLFFDFVCFNGCHFTLLDFAKKGQCTKILFWHLTHLSNIFASQYKNLEMYFMILICFEFWPLCRDNNLLSQTMTKSNSEWTR